MSNRTKIRVVIVVVLCGLFAWLIYYAATHGRVVIENVGDKSIILTSLQDPNASLTQVEVGNGAFVRSGVYTVQNSQDGQLRMARVVVPGWFGGASVTFGEIKTAQIQRRAALSYENFFPSSNGEFISYTDLEGYASKFTTHPGNDAFGGQSNDTALTSYLISPTISRSGQLLGINDNELLQLSPSTKQITPIVQFGSLEEDDHLSLSLKNSSTLSSKYIAAYEAEKDELRIIDDTNKVTLYSSVSTGTQSAAFDVNDIGWVVAKNTSNVATSSDTSNEEEKLPYEIIFRKHSATKNNKIAIGSASYIGAIALSPDGKYIAVSKGGYLWVYNTENSEVVIANPATNANQFFWKDTKLYSLSAELGVTVFDTKTNQLLPISLNTSNALSFSKAVAVGDKLYVSAYNTNFESDLPDGYEIDLGATSDGVTEALAQKLPITNESYDISFLGSIIYIRVRNILDTPAEKEETRRSAESRVKDTISKDTLNRTKIIFVN